MKDSGAPSYVVGVVMKDRLVYARPFGLADVATRRAATLDTLYQVGSLTKTFTATLLCQLRDEGKLTLDDPADQFLPTEVRLPADPLGAANISLWHLLTHSSGLPRDPVNRQNLPDSPAVMLPYSLDELYCGLRETRLDAPVGARWNYSNLGMGLAGHIAERAGGRKYESLLQDRLLKPLGMRDTAITLTDSQLDRFATHYWYGDKSLSPRERWMPGEVVGMAYIASTVPDLARYVAMYLRCNDPEATSARPVRGATLAEICRAQRMISQSWKTAQGLAWSIERLDQNMEIVSHGGEVDGNSAYVAFSPLHGVGVIVLANTGRDAAQIVGEPLIQAIVRAAAAERAAALEWALTQQWEDAVAALSVVIERVPSDGEAQAALGMACLSLNHNERAARALERAVLLGRDRAVCSYNAGCGWAKAGRTEEAFRCLFDARSYGFTDRRQMEIDPDLDSLRADLRWLKVMASE